ncbi:dihydrolipoyl dehydrogenase [Mycoplasmopsis agassizii]|uniref:dihydrolipoyl dehydrogenase n=1 Tax=Mycoplasmopsis agassizii TaxID=33922 RepID=UPI0035271955
MYKFKFADIGEGLHEGNVAEVYVKVGQEVKEGDSLFSVETDKMTSDIPSPKTGKIAQILLEEGKTIHVGDVIFVIDDGSGGSLEEAAPAPAAEPESAPAVVGNISVSNEIKPTTGLSFGSKKATSETASAPVSTEVETAAASNKEAGKAYTGSVEKEYDVIIIGAGPGGYLAAEESSKLGFKTLVIEKEFWGGVCLNIGCIPTKALLNSTHHLEAITSAEEVGVVFKNKVSEKDIDFAKSWVGIQAKKDQVVTKIVGGVKMLLKAAKVDTIEAEAKFVGAHEVEALGKVYRGKRIVLATGSISRKLTLPGFEEGYKSGKVITSRSAINMTEYPKALTIVGAGVIGLEMAQVYASAGVDVTVVQNSAEVLNPKIAKSIKDALVKKLTDKYGVKFIFNAAVKEFKNSKLVIEVEGKTQELAADKTLVSIGRVTVPLNAKDMGVKFKDNGVIEVDENNETNVKDFYAIGDVNARNMLAHAAYSQAQELVRYFAGHKHIYEKHEIPAAIYTSPEIATVGLAHHEAVEKGYKVTVAKYGYAHLGRAIATAKETGVAEIYVNEEDGRILGAQIFGANASDFISEITLAMDNEITIFEIAATVHPHPSYAEILWEAARGAVLKLEKARS